MQVILTELLARRWARAGIARHGVPPAWADTPSVRSSIPRFWQVMRKSLPTPEQGARTLVWLAVAPALPPGRLLFDRGPQPTHLLPFTVGRPCDRARLSHMCKRLADLASSSEDPRSVQG